MAEVFKPRENMVFNEKGNYWKCIDENGHLICDGGPSEIWSKSGIVWMFKEQGLGLHRLDGPATSGGLWYIRGKTATNVIHTFAKENDIDLDNLSDEDKVLIALKFG